MDSNFSRVRKRLAVIAVVIIAGILLYWYFSPAFSVKKLIDIQNAAEQFAITQIEKQISTPPPLRGPRSTAPPTSSFLTRSGIVVGTNMQRKENGNLPPLSEDATLDTIARSRLRDMFQKQYFAHVAPNGESAVMVAKSVGYDYIALGENLALGNYAGDRGVVVAWMNSPGHRANILNNHYTQIGVAVGEGTFEGEDTWIAVQIFGKPASDCPGPDTNLKTVIDNAEYQLSQMEGEIQAEKAELDAMEPHYRAAYNQKVGEYNGLVDKYNTLLGQTKLQIFTYDGEVNIFNQCIGS